MQVASLEDVEPEETGGAVQTSTILKKGALVGDTGDQVVTISEIRFRPGERTKYHTHDYGQTLYVTDGRGVVATRDEEREVTEGDLIFFPPGEEHWHGTAEDSDDELAHLSIVLRDAVGEGTHPVEDQS